MADKDEPQPASEVAEVTETRELVVAAVTSAELAESAEQPGAEVSEEQQAGVQMADFEVADNEELVEATMAAEGDQQPEAEAEGNSGQTPASRPTRNRSRMLSTQVRQKIHRARPSVGSSRRGRDCGRLGPVPRQISASAGCCSAWLRGQRTGFGGPRLQP